MATISSLGVGSGGLDVKSIVSQLVTLEKRPLDALKLQATTVQTKISAFGQIKSLVSTLSDAASKLTSVTGWNGVSTMSSNSTAVSASAAGGTLPTSFSVSVQGLAKAQAQASGVLMPIGGMLGTGKLRLELGQWSVSPASFTPRSGTPVELDVTAEDTVASIASKINGASIGVTATVLTDPATNSERLLLKGTGTGQSAGFRLSVEDDDGSTGDDAGLSRLVDGSMISQYAANAQATVNGIVVSSDTNTFSNTVAGVTFKALMVTEDVVDPATGNVLVRGSGPSEITVAKDTSAVQQNIDAFVKAYNDINGVLSEATKYDAGTKAAGLLQGDSTTVSLQNALRTAVQSVSSSSSVFTRLTDIGITLQRDGNLEVNTAKLSQALDQPDQVKAMFRGADVMSSDGVAVKIKAVTAALLGNEGFFKTKNDSLQRMLDSNTANQSRVNARAANVEVQLNRRYSALDSKLSSLSALSAYVGQQVTTWNKSSG